MLCANCRKTLQPPEFATALAKTNSGELVVINFCSESCALHFFGMQPERDGRLQEDHNRQEAVRQAQENIARKTHTPTICADAALSELVEFVFACERAARQEDRIDAIVRNSR